MAQAATRRMSAVRERHAASPVQPVPASKPGEPSTASHARRRSTRSSSGGAGGSARAGGGGAQGDQAKSEDGVSWHLSLPGGKDISLPGGRDVSLPHPHLSIWARLALRVAKRVARHELSKVLDKPRELDVSALRPGLPVQLSTDIAVPLNFAWKKWMELSFLPEGVDSVVDIERSGEDLSGRLDGEPDGSWAARILDERECESFAWQSTEGSDCAGLVTFHRLSDRLTRIELSLDVVPRSATDAVSLLTHLADWRAVRQMRRFKAELEVISPDAYADEDSSSR